MENTFEILNSVNCSDKIEKKNNLSYLSWSWAWTELKKRFPKSKRTVYEFENKPYFNDGKTGWVKVGITIEEQEEIDYLPIMDFRNQSIPLEKITSMDVNKAIQRSTTKAIALHGLGLYVYAGEDLPESSIEDLKSSISTLTTIESLTEFYNKNKPIIDSNKELLEEMKKVKGFINSEKVFTYKK